MCASTLAFLVNVDVSMLNFEGSNHAVLIMCNLEFQY